MTTIFQCSHCGAPAKAGAVTCTYCHSVLVVSSPAAAAVSAAPAGVAADVLAALRKKNKLEAIRLYREAYKCSLVDAKNAVEALEKQLGLA